MSKLFIFLFFILYLFPHAVSAQNITGIISAQDEAVEDASVVIRKNNEIIYFAFSDSIGRFSFKKDSLNNISVEVFKKRYLKQKFNLVVLKDTIVKIDLFEESILLNEIIVKKERPVIVKKDTTVYNPDLFKDGTERVVEDLLKKLPGITVKDDGKIFFKNREIQSLMLDGDDLFNAQYSKGSKNIPIEMVESVEAIENFSTNKVLRKITDSENVALNLKLKESKTDLALNADLQNDFYSKYNNVITGILINHKLKGFATVGFNNLGVVDDQNFAFANKDNKQFSIGRNQQLLSQGNFPTFLGDNNSLLNDSKNSYTSFISDLSSKTKTNSGFTYYQDKISQDFSNEIRYSTTIENSVISTREIQIKRPRTLGFNNKTTYYNGKDLQIESKFLAEINNSDLHNDIVNNGAILKSDLITRSFFLGGKSDLTKQISSSSAINAVLFLSNANSSQDFNVSPGWNSLNLTDSESKQTSVTKSLYFSSNVEFYKNWDVIKFKISDHFEAQKENLSTALYNIEDLQQISGFNNDVNFNSFSNLLQLDATYKTKKINLKLNSRYWHNKLIVNGNSKKKDDVLLNVNFKYRFTSKSSISLIYSEEINTPNLENLFEGFVLNSFRTVVNNQRIIDYIKKREGSISYNLHDIYNTFTMNIGGGYSSSDKDYYQKIQITDDVTFFSTILLNFGNDRYYLNFSTDKLIPFLKTTIKLTSSYSHLSSFNLFNNSELRNVNSEMFNLELFLYTGFKSRLNFQNKTTAESVFYKVNNATNRLNQIKNEFRIIYKISDTNNLNCQLQTFVPDSRYNTKYNFVNVELTHKFVKPNIETYIKGQNLLNIKKYEDRFISDIASSSYSYNLQERFILLGAIYKFI